MAVYPPTMSIFQTPILVMYLRCSDKIKKLFETMEKETHIIPKQV
ncbi:hypothetical protein [Staphylothermus hellenicus]|nr:hypothetical protein [Staphylothermus hellenicus]